jgi:hypothetical protein
VTARLRRSRMKLSIICGDGFAGQAAHGLLHQGISDGYGLSHSLVCDRRYIFTDFP